MKKNILLSFMLLQSVILSAQDKVQIRVTAASPAASYEQEVGSAKIKISYSRPLVRGRKIFGELVPFDKLWRTGASDCTVITTSEDISFGNNVLKTGSYSIFTIPSINEWTIIINTDTTLHGETGYDEKKMQALIKEKVTFEEFFKRAKLNPNAKLITGVICGYRVEEIEDPLTQKVRYLDKLVDELAKGRKMEKILRSGE